MPWILGSFQVTLCALTSCHVVISKQGSTIRAVEYNRCVTGRSRDENHAVRFGQNTEISRPVRGCQRWYPLAPETRYGNNSTL